MTFQVADAGRFQLSLCLVWYSHHHFQVVLYNTHSRGTSNFVDRWGTLCPHLHGHSRGENLEQGSGAFEVEGCIFIWLPINGLWGKSLCLLQQGTRWGLVRAFDRGAHPWDGVAWLFTS